MLGLWMNAQTYIYIVLYIYCGVYSTYCAYFYVTDKSHPQYL